MTKDMELLVGNDQNTIDRVIGAVLGPNKELLPFVRHLAGNHQDRAIVQFAAWLVNETQPDLEELNSTQKGVYRYYLKRAKAESYRLSQLIDPDKWTRKELIRWARIGQWSKNLSVQAIDDILKEPSVGYGLGAPLYYMWVESQEIDAFLKGGKHPSWKPTTEKHKKVWQAFLTCLKLRIFRIPVDRVNDFYKDLLSWLSIQESDISERHHIESSVFYNHSPSTYTSKQLQSMVVWNRFAAVELTNRRIPLENPKGEFADVWIYNMLKRIPKHNDWRDALAEYKNSTCLVRKRAIWNHFCDEMVINPTNPFDKNNKVKWTSLVDPPEDPSYDEVVNFFDLNN